MKRKRTCLLSPSFSLRRIVPPTRLIATILALVCAVGLTRTALAAPGALDSSFGQGGIVMTYFGKAYAMLRQPDGKLILVGETAPGGVFAFGLVRYNPDGNLDAGFGTGGKVVTELLPGTAHGEELALAVALQPDGKLVVAGTVNYANDLQPAMWELAVARYNPDGSLDTSFGTAGRIFTKFGDPAADPAQVESDAYAVAIQPDGKIVVAGHAAFYYQTPPIGGVALARYNPDGSLDASFASNGKLFSNLLTTARSLALAADGKLIVGGFGGDTSSDFALARFNPDGSPDTSFGTGGRALTDLAGGGDEAYAMALYPDGKIVLGGQANGSTALQSALARYNPDGSLDTSFGTGGKILSGPVTGRQLCGPARPINALMLQPNGQIVVAGQESNGSNADFTITRYNSDGSLDAGFGMGGKVMTNLNTDDCARALAIQPDGKAVVSGFARGNFALARYDLGDINQPVIIPTISGPLGQNGWYVGPVTVRWTVMEGLLPSSSTGCLTVTLSADTNGSTLTCTVTVSGRTYARSVMVKIDQTPATLTPSVSPNPVVLNGSATASANATDGGAGIAAASCTQVITSAIGRGNVTCQATDKAGNRASASASYQVIYAFGGFFAPVVNLPTWNVVRSGSLVPVKFSLGGNQGLAIFAAGYPTSTPVACAPTAPSVQLNNTAKSGSGLTYNATTGQYTWVWPTDRAWAGQCRQLVLKLMDGTEHRANFQFSR